MFSFAFSQAIEKRIAQEKRAVSERRVADNKRLNDVHHKDFEAVLVFLNRFFDRTSNVCMKPL